MLASINISQGDFETRAANLLTHLQDEGLSGVVLFDSDYILYFTRVFRNS